MENESTEIQFATTYLLLRAQTNRSDALPYSLVVGDSSVSICGFRQDGAEKRVALARCALRGIGKLIAMKRKARLD